MGYMAVIEIICREIDALYTYAKNLIPKEIQHRLGYKKEKVKQLVEELIKALCEE